MGRRAEEKDRKRIERQNVRRYAADRCYAMILRSRRVVAPDGVRPASIHIDGERIERIGDYGDPADVDYGDLVIMPGLVDSHVHVNEPGRAEWEGFESATR